MAVLMPSKIQPQTSIFFLIIIIFFSFLGISDKNFILKMENYTF